MHLSKSFFFIGPKSTWGPSGARSHSFSFYCHLKQIYIHVTVCMLSEIYSAALYYGIILDKVIVFIDQFSNQQ